jgi:hypothetical protein
VVLLVHCGLSGTTAVATTVTELPLGAQVRLVAGWPLTANVTTALAGATVQSLGASGLVAPGASQTGGVQTMVGLSAAVQTGPEAVVGLKCRQQAVMLWYE